MLETCLLLAEVRSMSTGLVTPIKASSVDVGKTNSFRKVDLTHRRARAVNFSFSFLYLDKKLQCVRICRNFDTLAKLDSSLATLKGFIKHGGTFLTYAFKSFCNWVNFHDCKRPIIEETI